MTQSKGDYMEVSGAAPSLTVGAFYDVMDDVKGELRSVNHADWRPYFGSVESVVARIARLINVREEDVFGKVIARARPLPEELVHQIEELRQRKMALAQLCIDQRAQYNFTFTTQSDS